MAKKTKAAPLLPVSMDDFLRHLESQRKSATKMIKLARKMKAQAILIRKQLRRTA